MSWTGPGVMKAVTAPSHYIGVECRSPDLGQRAGMSSEEDSGFSKSWIERRSRGPTSRSGVRRQPLPCTNTAE
jgi:hypothetical protein